jgi:hypothetical protein
LNVLGKLLKCPQGYARQFLFEKTPTSLGYR